MSDDDQQDHGQSVAGRIVYELEAVGVLALILAVASMVTLEGASQWYAVAAFLFVSAVAFGMLANAVLRR
jgi:hypothetical protein